MREHLVEQGLDPAEAVQVWESRHSLAPAQDACRFRRDLDLPNDARALTMDQLDQLIAYHDSLRERSDEAVDRLDELRDKRDVAQRAYGSEVVADLRRTDAAPLREAWTEASAECNWCRRELEAVGAYTEPLLEEEEG